MESIEKRINDQIIILEDAIIKARQDEIVDIGLVDQEITALSRDISSLTPKQAHSVSTKVLEIISRLENYATEIESYKERLQEFLTQENKSED